MPPSSKISGRSTIAPSVAKALLAAMSVLSVTIVAAIAQLTDIPPELTARMAKEKEARRTCKVEICTAFAKPAPGAPITCDVTKTWTRQDITTRVVGGSYIWRYGHMQCSVKLTLDRGALAKAMSEAKTTASFPEHALVCVVDDSDPAKGQAFSISAKITPVVAFEGGQAKSVALDPVKTEGSTVASAAVTSMMAVEKATGFISRAAAAEINNFLFERCKEDGVEITHK